MEKLYFDDIDVGQKFTGDTVTVDRKKMLSMAEDFDDQPMHTDAQAARKMGFDDIIASGAYIFSLSIKAVQSIISRFYFLPSGRGIEVSFVNPVYSGDTLTAHGEVISKRSSEKGNRGWIVVKVDYTNQNGRITTEVSWPWLVETRQSV